MTCAALLMFAWLTVRHVSEAALQAGTVGATPSPPRLRRDLAEALRANAGVSYRNRTWRMPAEVKKIREYSEFGSDGWMKNPLPSRR